MLLMTTTSLMLTLLHMFIVDLHYDVVICSPSLTEKCFLF